jgi:hypothetical protein
MGAMLPGVAVAFAAGWRGEQAVRRIVMALQMINSFFTDMFLLQNEISNEVIISDNIGLV